jgi:glucan phosphoethanolaminetransferase (alkaline phosphatase superfamily)
MYRDSNRRPFLWLLFLLSAAVAIALFFIPAFIIRPFTHQTARGLNIAMALRQRAPWATLIAAAACVFFAIPLWRTRGIWRSIPRRTALSVVILLVAFSTVMARLNYFEWMFHPVQDVRFDSAASSKLDKSEPILALNFNGDARAYPIKEMAYHHIVNDVIGGVPVAVTY